MSISVTNAYFVIYSSLLLIFSLSAYKIIPISFEISFITFLFLSSKPFPCILSTVSLENSGFDNSKWVIVWSLTTETFVADFQSPLILTRPSQFSEWHENHMQLLKVVFLANYIPSTIIWVYLDFHIKGRESRPSESDISSDTGD